VLNTFHTCDGGRGEPPRDLTAETGEKKNRNSTNSHLIHIHTTLKLHLAMLTMQHILHIKLHTEVPSHILQLAPYVVKLLIGLETQRKAVAKW
jgi:hypothetical protein